MWLDVWLSRGSGRRAQDGRALGDAEEDLDHVHRAARSIEI